MKPAPRLKGARLKLAPFGAASISDRYLAWLGDPVVNQYSRRLGQATPTRAEAVHYLEGLLSNEAILSIHCPTLGHIGNIKYGPLGPDEQSADISILIGERSAWGRGFGSEAIYLVSRWLFERAGLASVTAGSANPAFLALVRNLGWSESRTPHPPVQIGAKLLDWALVELERNDFVRRRDLESEDGEFVTN